MIFNSQYYLGQALLTSHSTLVTLAFHEKYVTRRYPRLFYPLPTYYSTYYGSSYVH